MTEISERYGRIVTTFGAHLAAIRTEQWHAPTPCDEWDVRALVTHVTSTQLRVRALLDDSLDTTVDGDGDLAAQFGAASRSILDALDDAQVAATVVNSGFGEQPFDTLVSSLCCSDTLVHTWDLARAIGADETLDSAAVDVALVALVPVDDALRRPGGFGDKLVPADESDAQSALLAFCGRNV